MTKIVSVTLLLCISIYTGTILHPRAFYKESLSDDQLQLCEYIEQCRNKNDENGKLYISLTPAQEKVIKELPLFVTKESLFQGIMFTCRPSMIETMYYIGRDFIESPGYILWLASYGLFAPIMVPIMVYVERNLCLYETHKSIDMILKK
jgi:hypothetical protein